MFGGLIVAILTMTTVDAGQENSWWFAALIPIAAVAGYLARFGYAYGRGIVDGADAEQLL